MIRRRSVALPKKGSRLITVSETVYRWRVRHKPTYCQGNGWTPMTFAIELAEKPGNALLVTLPYARPDNWLCEQWTSIRPALVWTPHLPGSAHRLELTHDDLPLLASSSRLPR
jgi:hypothetical protein